MRRRLFQVDAFTTEVLTGNPAGVVLDAEGLSEAQMLAIAREMNKSETAFVVDRPGEGYDLELRFFTPTREVPLCGHATVGAFYAYAREKGLGAATLVQKTKAGLLPVEILPEEGDLRIVMTQGRVEFLKRLTPAEVADLLLGLGLEEGDLAPDLPVEIVSTGYSKVMVALARKSRLDALSVDAARLSGLSARIGCNGFYAFTLDDPGEGLLAAGRMFAPASGVLEDPVTGNANGPLGAFLTRHGVIPARAEGYRFAIVQGEAMGRRGTMSVEVFSEGGEARLVKIGGRAVLAFRATLDL